MGLGSFWTVIIFAVFVIVASVIVVEVCKYNTKRTKEKILFEMYYELLDSNIIGTWNEWSDLYDDAKEADVKGLLKMFADLFFRFSPEELKTLVVIKPDYGKDPYNMWQDVQDILCHVREAKEKRKKQAW
jgi:hypothetical protein